MNDYASASWDRHRIEFQTGIRATIRMAIIVCVSALCARAQNTIGVTTRTNKGLDSGYVLFAPLDYTDTYLIDKCGDLAHTWHSSYPPALDAYLLPDGSILRAATSPPPDSIAGSPAITERIAWDGAVTWSYRLLGVLHGQHHDLEPLPNGDVLIIAQDYFSTADAYAAGRDTSVLHRGFFGDGILELRPVGDTGATIVWEWHARDHLVQHLFPDRAHYATVADHPELINVNYGTQTADWLHVNSVRYNARRNEIMISSHNINELWIIDHSTSTAEAASHTGGARGHGGDLLYRWGNPAAYDHGGTQDQKFFGQHDAHWIGDGLPEAGKIMVINNGLGRPSGAYSSVDVVAPAYDSAGNYALSNGTFLPAAQDWIYTATPPSSFYTPTLGACQMLANHDVLVCDGFAGVLFEVDTTGEVVWRYVVPVNAHGPMAQGTVPSAGDNPVFKTPLYPFSFSGVLRARVGGAPIERDPAPAPCDLNIDTASTDVRDPAPLVHTIAHAVYPNPANARVSVDEDAPVDCMRLYNAMGELVRETRRSRQLETRALPQGVYLLVVQQGNRTWTRPVTIAR